jgi:hypothetical protein
VTRRTGSDEVSPARTDTDVGARRRLTLSGSVVSYGRELAAGSRPFCGMRLHPRLPLLRGPVLEVGPGSKETALAILDLLQGTHA